jgi:hypothetical protein
VNVKERSLEAYREYCASGDSFTEVVERAIDAAIAEEREACAKVVDGWRRYKASSDMADAIRARSTK